MIGQMSKRCRGKEGPGKRECFHRDASSRSGFCLFKGNGGVLATDLEIENRVSQERKKILSRFLGKLKKLKEEKRMMEKNIEGRKKMKLQRGSWDRILMRFSEKKALK